MGKYVIRVVTEKNPAKRHRTKLNDVLVDKDFSQTKLVNGTKLMHSQVSALVRGTQTDMLLSTAKRICNCLDVSLDELWGEGVIDYKTQVLNYIDAEMRKLDGNDIYGKLWLEKFKDFALKMKM